MQVTPLPGSFGAEITGIDVAAALAPATMRALVDALYRHRVIVIRQQTLTPGAYLAFGQKWGRPHPHALDHLRMPGFPALMAIGNTETKDRDETVRNGAAFWHTDQSYEAEPSSATMLYALKVPQQGGETLIADQVAAYEALDDDTRSRIDGLLARHLYGAASGRDGERIAAPIRTGEQIQRLPEVLHRLVRPHPVTGIKTLYAVAGTPCGIVGMDDEEALALLGRLKAHAVQPRFVYKHKYRIGDIAVWDTAATLHSGVPIDVATDERNARLLWRISVKGRPAVVAEPVAGVA